MNPIPMTVTTAPICAEVTGNAPEKRRRLPVKRRRLPAHPPLNARVDPAVVAELDTVAERLGLSRSDVVREAIRQLLAADAADQRAGETT